MSSIPVREMIKNAVEDLGGKASYKQIIEWITTKYGDVNHNTVKTQTMACSVNRTSRIHLPECGKPRGFDSRYDFLYQTESGQVELYEPAKHGNWEIKEHDGKTRIAHNGKIISSSDEDEFYFVEKDFESATKNKEDSQYLHTRFKILKEVIANNLGESFRNSNSYVGHPFNQGSKEWNEYQWLGFWRTGSKQDSVQFQVSINNEDDLSLFIWIDGLSEKTKENAAKEIELNSEKFMNLIQKLPSDYGIGLRVKKGEYLEKNISEIDSEFLNKITEILHQKKTEFYIARYFSKTEAIEYKTKIIDEICGTFEKLVPISEFLELPNSDNSMSPLLIFLKEEMTMKANYQPIVIKTLLENGNDYGFTASIDQIKENIKQLNFDRPFNFTDAVNAVKEALKNYVSFSDKSALLHLDQFDSRDIPECLKICGQKIAKWHIDNITKSEYEMWYIMPGGRKEDFLYLDEFLKTNSIGVGWDKTGDISNLTEPEVKQKFVEQYESETGWPGFFNFTKIKTKDIVILTKGQEEIVDFGIVVGDYKFKNVRDPSYAHRKEVVWLKRGPISAKELSDPTLSWVMATCGKLIKRKQEMVETLLENQNSTSPGNYFIITQNPESKYDDKPGVQYAYDSQKPHYTKFVEGTNFIVQTKTENQYYFVGYGKVESIEKSEGINEKGKPITNIIAKFSKYTKFEEQKIRTDEINKKMLQLAFPNTGFNSQPPAMLPITLSLYREIIGEDLGEASPPKYTLDDVDLNPFIQALKWKPNLILYGPPGTGKTYHANEIAKSITRNQNSNEIIADFKQQTWLGIAAKILLENNGTAINYNDFGKLASQFRDTDAQTPEETIARDIRDHIRKFGDQSIFSNPKEGMYGLHIPTTFVKAAEIILLARHEPMQSNEIAKVIVERNLVETKGETPERTLSTEFFRDRQAGENSTFIQIKPGTYALRNQVTNITKKSSFIKMVTFHPSYSYEDFVEGFRPNVNDSRKQPYVLEDGIFKLICQSAKNDPDNVYVLLIDEINRGNIPKILGELITLIEEDKRNEKYALTLAYSKEDFFVPPNLRIIATMNTADKSLMQMDDALKRRFVFEELMPDTTALLEHLKKEKVANAEDYKKILDRINEKILGKGKDDYEQKMKQFRDRQIGHSYFWEIKNDENLQSVIKYDIIPLLQDYFYGDYNEIKKILGDKIISDDSRSTNLVIDKSKANELKTELLKI